MVIGRENGRKPNQLRPMDCTRNVLNRAHGSANCSHGETRVLAAVYGPKSGTKKNDNPEKSSLEVIWKSKTGQVGKEEKMLETILKKTLQNICILTAHPNTTTSVIIQVVNDDGSLLPCAVHAACTALIDAGLPLKYLTVSMCCGVAESGDIMLDPDKKEEQKIKSSVNLVFPSPVGSVLSTGSTHPGESAIDGIITSFTNGVMAVDDYLKCVRHGQAAISPLSKILKKKLQAQSPSQ